MEGSIDMRLPYIPEHLHYMLFELLKVGGGKHPAAGKGRKASCCRQGKESTLGCRKNAAARTATWKGRDAVLSFKQGEEKILL
jgi:hypothetical protein